MGRCVATLLVIASCAAPRQAPPMFPGGIEAVLVGRESNSVIVPVRVNGHLMRFIVDSGASISALTPATAARLGIEPTGRTIVNDASTPIAIVESLAIATAEHRDLRVAIVDLPAARRMNVSYDGILGLDVLGAHDVVIDFARGLLVLHPVGHLARSEASRAMTKVPFRPSRHGLMLMTADVSFVPIPAVLDLGAQYSLVNRAACAMGGITVGTMTQPRDVQVGDLDLGERRMLVADLPIFSRTGLMSGPAIILGADIFEQRTIGLSYQQRAIYVSR